MNLFWNWLCFSFISTANVCGCIYGKADSRYKNVTVFYSRWYWPKVVISEGSVTTTAKFWKLSLWCMPGNCITTYCTLVGDIFSRTMCLSCSQFFNGRRSCESKLHETLNIEAFWLKKKKNMITYMQLESCTIQRGELLLLQNAFLKSYNEESIAIRLYNQYSSI